MSVTEWWYNLTDTERFALMKKYDFKNPTNKTLKRILKQEINNL